MWMVYSPLKMCARACTHASWKARCLLKWASVPAAALPSRKKKEKKNNSSGCPPILAKQQESSLFLLPAPISTLCVNSGTTVGAEGGQEGWRYRRSLSSENYRSWHKNTGLLAKLQFGLFPIQQSTYQTNKQKSNNLVLFDHIPANFHAPFLIHIENSSRHRTLCRHLY